MPTSAQPSPSPSSAPPASSTAPSGSRPALLAAAGATAVGVLGRLAFDLWHPPLDERVYDPSTLHHLGSTTWLVMHAAVGGPSAVLAFTGLALLVVAACPRRGALLAAVGAVLAGLGSLSFCLAVAAEGVAWWYATADGVLPDAVGDTVMAAFAEHPAPVDVPAVAGALAVVLGLLALLAALWRAGAAPRWLLAAVAVVALSGAAPLPGGLVPVRGALESAALLALAWCALRAGRTGGRVELR